MGKRKRKEEGERGRVLGRWGRGGVEGGGPSTLLLRQGGALHLQDHDQHTWPFIAIQKEKREEEGGGGGCFFNKKRDDFSLASS